MKPTNKKNQKELKLQRRLALVRTTIRELQPAQLEQVIGGGPNVENSPDGPPTCLPFYTI